MNNGVTTLSQPASFENESPVLLEVKGLKKYFPIKKGLLKKTVGYVKAVDDISFSIKRGETFGLVGESGSGKTTLGRTLLRLQEPTAGKIVFDGQDILTLNSKQMRQQRREMQIVFQDPVGSLNPRMTVGNIIGEMYKVHGIDGANRQRKIADLLEMVGINASRINDYPHEFSGGQRQRIGIARAIALDPKFILADEAVSALDVSVQAQIINLLKDLQNKLGLTYLFIAHGLNVIRYISDRIGVMYLGQMVEIGLTEDIFKNPAHPYTHSLIASNPGLNPHVRTQISVIAGEIPSPANPPSGCRFHTRCPLATERCIQEAPEITELDPNHLVACHYPLG